MSLVPMRGFGDPVLPRRSILDGRPLELSDPAIYAVTDFKRDYPMTVDAERQIDDALSDMIRLSVRALLVAQEQRLVGLITSYDIQGERPIQFLQSSNYSRHEDIRVVHVMTPWDELSALDWEQVEAARAEVGAAEPDAGLRPQPASAQAFGEARRQAADVDVQLVLRARQHRVDSQRDPVVGSGTGEQRRRIGRERGHRRVTRAPSEHSAPARSS